MAVHRQCRKTASAMDAIDAARAKAVELALRDQQSGRQEFVFALSTCWDSVYKQWLNDERDTPCFWLLANIFLTTLPAAILLHAFRVESHAAGLSYFVISYVLYLQRLSWHFQRRDVIDGCLLINN
jgi:hypothetical protein